MIFPHQPSSYGGYSIYWKPFKNLSWSMPRAIDPMMPKATWNFAPWRRLDFVVPLKTTRMSRAFHHEKWRSSPKKMIKDGGDVINDGEVGERNWVKLWLKCSASDLWNHQFMKYINIPIGSVCMPYMVTFTINKNPNVRINLPYMDPSWDINIHNFVFPLGT